MPEWRLPIGHPQHPDSDESKAMREQQAEIERLSREATVPEQQPSDAVKAADAVIYSATDLAPEPSARVAGAVVDAVEPIIRAPLEAENARLRKALSRVAYGLEGEMGRYDAPRDNTWWGRIALEALGGDRA